MRASRWKTILAPVLLMALPVFIACEPADDSGMGDPGMMDGQPAQPGMEGQVPGAEQSTSDVSDEQVEAMAEAYVALNELQSDADARAAAAPTPEEQNQIQAEATSEMQSVLQEHGMSVEQYQQMVQLINTDENVRARFEEAVADIEG